MGTVLTMEVAKKWEIAGSLSASPACACVCVCVYNVVSGVVVLKDWGGYDGKR